MKPLPILLSLLGASGLSLAQDPVQPTTPPAERETTLLETLTVIGSLEDIPRIAGSAAVLPESAIRTQNYTNPNRVLQQVPGVYVREEDGFGNFPNISIRGADPGRSSKTTIMEDGILMAPAPYSAPAAYYSPRIGRMSNVEILKGSSQVRYGPHTTGGVVNYISTPFVGLEGGDYADEFYLKSSFGSFNTWRNHAYWGQTLATSAGVFGYVLEFNHEHSDGFRSIIRDNGDTGYTVYEPMLKVFFEPDTAIRQRFEFRIGYSDFEGLETYVGLSDRDFRRDPFRRYPSTQFDVMDSQQFRTSLTYIIEPTDSLRFETTGYFNKFSRSWYKLQDVRPTGGANTNPAVAIGAGSGAAFDLITGRGAGSWRVRDNNRVYNAFGLQTRMDWDFATGPLQHSLTLGARLHYDEEDRFQRDDRYEVNALGQVVNKRRGIPGAQANRVDSTTALALFLEDEIEIGNLTLKPGIRYEHLWQETRNFNAGTFADGSLSVVAPGIGAVYQFTDTLSAFGSYYRGISTPGPSARLNDNQKAEYSDGFELGARWYTPKVRTELIGFYTRHTDLIVPDIVGAAGTTDTTNAGDIEVYGIEAAISYDPMAETGSDWHLPMRAALTLTHAELTSNTPSADAESIFSGGRAGNKVPYIPEYNITFGIGVEYKRLGVYLDGTYTPETFGTASNTRSGLNTAGTPDARFGTSDSAFLLDLSVKYNVTDNVRLFAGVSNLLDEHYVVSRLPYGARAGAPRMWYGGLELRF